MGLQKCMHKNLKSSLQKNILPILKSKESINNLLKNQLINPLSKESINNKNNDLLIIIYYNLLRSNDCYIIHRWVQTGNYKVQIAPVLLYLVTGKVSDIFGN